MKRTGFATLPLHWGKTPSWLFEEMRKLAREISLTIIREFGVEEFLKRLSDPFWFQSFGCVLGFDWHSSGLTTVTLGALKEALKPEEENLKLFIVGGKGKTSRKAPEEINLKGEKYNLYPSQVNNLVYASQMSAKVDNTAVQDKFQIYHHNFIFTKGGLWVVIQQGMNPDISMARRYHWISDKVRSFVEEPHSGIISDFKGRILNLVAKDSEDVREKSIELITKANPASLVKDIKKLDELKMPRRHPIYKIDFRSRRLEKIIYQVHEKKPENFEKLLGTKGVGPKTIRALALVAELIYGKKASWEDPARFSFAHGGKDGYPYPVRKDLMEQSIEVLRKGILKSHLQRSEKRKAEQRALAMLK